MIWKPHEVNEIFELKAIKNNDPKTIFNLLFKPITYIIILYKVKI